MDSLTLYIPGTSFFHKRDCRVKFIMLVTVALFVYLFFNPWIYMPLFVLAIIFDITALSFEGFINHMMTKMVIIMAVFLIIFHGFANPAGVTPALFFGKELVVPFFGAYTIEGFYMGITNLIRLSTVILTAELFVSTTSPAQLMTGFHKMGVPFNVCFMISMSLQLIPISSREASIINSAQRARGMADKTIVDRFKGLLPMFVPLVVSSLDRMEKMSMALECRGFGNSSKPTDLSDIKIQTIDIVLIVLYVALFVGGAAARIMYGKFDIVSQVKTWADLFQIM